MTHNVTHVDIYNNATHVIKYDFLFVEEIFISQITFLLYETYPSNASYMIRVYAYYTIVFFFFCKIVYSPLLNSTYSK